MRENVVIQDDFLDNFDDFNIWLRQQTFKQRVNPVDGVEYPDIFLDIPQSILTEISDKVGEVHNALTFCRLSSSKTLTAPHQSHNDRSMGEFTFLLYMQDGEGGTSLVRHKELGMENGPMTFEDEDIWRRDTNKPDAWEVTDMIDMKANRAVWYPSKYMHRAEPIGGFGNDETDGRIVLTMFFS